MKEKFEIIAENLHLKGITKYIALGIFLIIILFISSKLLSIKPKEKEKQDIVFKLNGTKIITLYEYDKVEDLGVTAIDDNGKDVSSKVIKIGNVDTSKTGIYDITYKLNLNNQELRLERTYVVIANEGAYIELLGNKTINIGVGSKYVEPGYKAIDYMNGEVTDKVKVETTLDTNIPGEYVVVYSFVGSDDELKTATRTVIVNQVLPEDLSLELIGKEKIDMVVGQKYIDPGYKAKDNIEGDITEKVVTEGIVDTTKAGEYTIKYTVTNNSGIQKSIYRVVKVYEKNEGLLSFELIGKEKISIEEGTTYKDPGYKAIDTIDGDITNKVKIEGYVNTNTVGTYELKYTVTNSSGITKTLSRKVNVYAKKIGTITLEIKGNNPLLIENGGTYTEPGYKAVDTIDGDITSKVTVKGSVNTNLPGTYNIRYTVTNSTGITKEIIRKVIVGSDLTINLTNQTKGYSSDEISILVEVSGDSFKTLEFPNGKKINSKTAVYKVTANGEYKFKAYNINGREFINTIKITNIDKEGPTGSCTATINTTKTKTTIKVSATDTQSGINKYMYIVNGSTIEKTSSNIYVYNNKVNEVYVNLFDNVENQNKIKCNIIDEKPLDPGIQTGSGNIVYKKYGTISNYWLYLPDDYGEEQKPLLVYLHGKGEIGTSVKKLSNYAFIKYTNKGTRYNAIILMPQISSGEWSTENITTNLKKLIDEIVDKYNVDKSRISISGHSLGGIGTYAMVAKYPYFFSAAAPISGRYTTVKADKLIYTPIWALHGELDTSVSYDVDVKLISTVKSLGGNAQLTTFQRYGHNIVDKSLTETDVVNWLITSRR